MSYTAQLYWAVTWVECMTWCISYDFEVCRVFCSMLPMLVSFRSSSLYLLFIYLIELPVCVCVCQCAI